MIKIRMDKYNHFFMNFPVFKKWIHHRTEYLKTLKENIIKYWESLEDNLENRKRLDSYYKYNLPISFLLMFPRPIYILKEGDMSLQQQCKFNLLTIYHYSCFLKEIKNQGLRPYCFEKSKNDKDQEAKWFLRKSNLYDNKLIMKKALDNKYNSFSYCRIDNVANNIFISSCNNNDDYLRIDLVNFLDDWKKSGISENIFYGFVRYDVGETDFIYKFTEWVVNNIYKKIPSSRAFIEEIISIITTFVKRKEGEKKYDFSKEKEIRFLYQNINKKVSNIKLYSAAYRPIK